MGNYKDNTSQMPEIKRIVLFFFFLSFLAFYSSCKKDTSEPTVDKTTKPTITLVSKNIPTVTEFLCNASFNNVLKVNTGADLQIQFRFKGVNKLSQYKIDIHNNFDCHTHGKMAASNPWQVLKIVDLNDKEVEVSEQLTVPADASVGTQGLVGNTNHYPTNTLYLTKTKRTILGKMQPLPRLVI